MPVVVFVCDICIDGLSSENVSPTLHPNSKLKQVLKASSFLVNLKKNLVLKMEGALAFFQSMSFESGTVTLLTFPPWKHVYILPLTALPANGSPVFSELVTMGKAVFGDPSAAGGGRERAVVQVGGVHHRNWEVENERRGGRGCRRRGGRRGGLGPKQRARCGGRFCNPRGGEELRLELQQLAHEAEIGGDDAATPANKLEGFVQTHSLPLHQVGQADGGGARDACFTMDQHSPTGVPY